MVLSKLFPKRNDGRRRNFWSSWNIALYAILVKSYGKLIFNSCFCFVSAVKKQQVVLTKEIKRGTTVAFLNHFRTIPCSNCISCATLVLFHTSPIASLMHNFDYFPHRMQNSVHELRRHPGFFHFGNGRLAAKN